MTERTYNIVQGILMFIVYFSIAIYIIKIIPKGARKNVNKRLQPKISNDTEEQQTKN